MTVDLETLKTQICPEGWTVDAQWQKWFDGKDGGGYWSQGMMPFPDEDAEMLGVILRSPDGWRSAIKLPAEAEVLTNAAYLDFVKQGIEDQHREAVTTKEKTE